MIRLLTWALAIGGVLAYGYFTDVGRDDSGTVVKAGESNVTDLRVGDCLNIFDEEEAVYATPVVPCDQAHFYEIFASVTFEGGEYPGSEAINIQASEKCLAQFDRYFGISYQDSQLAVTTLYPLEEGWSKYNDREGSCLAYRMDEEAMMGRVRNF